MLQKKSKLEKANAANDAPSDDEMEEKAPMKEGKTLPRKLTLSYQEREVSEFGGDRLRFNVCANPDHELGPFREAHAAAITTWASWGTPE
jgi:hypothetical protein